MDKITILEEQGAKERERMKAEQNLPPIPFTEYQRQLEARREQIARERNQKIADAAWRLFINHLRVSQCDPDTGLYTGLQSPVVQVDNFAVNGDVTLREEEWGEGLFLDSEYEEHDGDWGEYCRREVENERAVAFNGDALVRSFGGID